jgi:hypothetical protein
MLYLLQVKSRTKMAWQSTHTLLLSTLVYRPNFSSQMPISPKTATTHPFPSLFLLSTLIFSNIADTFFQTPSCFYRPPLNDIGRCDGDVHVLEHRDKLPATHPFLSLFLLLSALIFPNVADTFTKCRCISIEQHRPMSISSNAVAPHLS